MRKSEEEMRQGDDPKSVSHNIKTRSNRSGTNRASTASLCLQSQHSITHEAPGASPPTTIVDLLQNLSALLDHQQKSSGPGLCETVWDPVDRTLRRPGRNVLAEELRSPRGSGSAKNCSSELHLEIHILGTGSWTRPVPVSGVRSVPDPRIRPVLGFQGQTGTRVLESELVLVRWTLTARWTA